MPLSRMQATPAIDMREKRAPTSRKAVPSRTRARTSRKHGIPPIQIAAPSWCRPSTSRRPPRWSRRAAAWVVSGGGGEFDDGQRQQRERRGALLQAEQDEGHRGSRGDLDHAGDGEAGGQDVGKTEVDGVHQDRGLQCNGSGLGQQEGEGSVAGDTGDRRRDGREPTVTPVRLRRGARGRARRTRNSTPPSAIDCDRIVRPWTTIER